MVHIPSLSILPSVSFPLPLPNPPSLSCHTPFLPSSSSLSPLPCLPSLPLYRLPSLPSLVFPLYPPSSSLSPLPRLPSLTSLVFPLYLSIVFPLYPPSSSLSTPLSHPFLSVLPSPSRIPILPHLPALPFHTVCLILSPPHYLYAGLLDPRWIEEQKRQTEEKRNQEVNFATGVHIGSHLKNLAERRTDIFGVEETVIGKRIGEEMGGPGGPKKPPVVQWDGHSGR